MAPSAYENISVEGISPAGSTRSLEYGVETAIKIPLIFQFRASDYIGYVGGWRSATPAGLKNIKYAKKIGLDLYTSDSVFSFDVLVKTQYEKETAVVTPVSQLEINLAGISASA
jgi:hypothetical protein